MAANSADMDSLTDLLRRGLNLNATQTSAEELFSNASPAELELFRRQLLSQQQMSVFDEVGLVQGFLKAIQRQQEHGKDGQQEDYTFYNQIMLPVVVEKAEQLPADFMENWWCLACPEGTRTLVVAFNGSTFAYDLEGNCICEHDSHLPGGSSADVSKVSDPNECTVIDCLYNDEKQTYYVLDVMCWAGSLLYRKDTEFRLQYLTEKMKQIPSLKHVGQTNPFRFVMVPMTKSCSREAICKIIAGANFKLTGLLFYHMSTQYTPGMTPLGCWLETHHIEETLSISTLQMNFPKRPPKQLWKKNRYEGSQEEEENGVSTSIKYSAFARNANNSARGRPVTRGHMHYHPAYNCGPVMHGYGGYDMGYDPYDKYSGYGNYGGYSIHGSYTYDYNYGNYGRRGRGRGGGSGGRPPSAQNTEAVNDGQSQDGKKKKKKKNASAPAKVMATVPVPDKIPNWEEPHEVMMSVIMEKIPEQFAEDWFCIICPVAKRRTVVANHGWTCSYNKLLMLDRKFQSVLPGGNVKFLQLVRNTDMCILDCLHYKAERTFFVLDIMFWRQMPYYDTEAEFRQHWIHTKLTEVDSATISLQNEYKFKPMPQVRCEPEAIKEALEQFPYKVDGLLFFHKQGPYHVGLSPNALWLEPAKIESVLGFKPPEPKPLPGLVTLPTSATATTEGSSSSGAGAADNTAATPAPVVS